MHDTVIKTTQLSAHAQNHTSLEGVHKSVTKIILGDHDFLKRLEFWQFGSI